MYNNLNFGIEGPLCESEDECTDHESCCNMNMLDDVASASGQTYAQEDLPLG